jgi:hypothetical protein
MGEREYESAEVVLGNDEAIRFDANEAGEISNQSLDVVEIQGLHSTHMQLRQHWRYNTRRKHVRF